MRPDRRAKGRGRAVSDLDKFIGDWNAARDAQVTLLKVEVLALQAENERLRKAGDDVCEEYSFMLVQNIYPPSTKAIRAWRAATKGVQP